ncbi:MAG: hypothetical protein R6U62_10490 [Bacteroidales bacterium]
MRFKQITIFLSLFFMLGLGSTINAQDDDYLNIGGAVRYNIVSQHYESDAMTTDTYATWDTWRLNVSASYSDVILDFEYRFYPTFNTHFIHHGYLGYNFSDNLNMQLGVTQVPFGNLTFNSHSWWFLTPYYVGLEDDYNMGVKFDYDLSESLNLKLAYFRQSEPAGPSYGSASFGGPAAGTYSYNVIPGMNADLRELNQFNARLGYMVTEGTEIGLSGQLQGLYNSHIDMNEEIDEDPTEYGHAIAAHVNSSINSLNIKLQFINYDYAARDNDGEIVDRVQMGAYGDPYYGDGVAARANIITAGIAYGIDVDAGPISNIQPYIDYSLMTKDGQINGMDFEDTHMLVPGFLITAGNIFTYVDFAMGKNHPWLTDSFGTGLGAGHLDDSGQPVPVDDMDWNLRFNINLGYYF